MRSVECGWLLHTFIPRIIVLVLAHIDCVSSADSKGRLARIVDALTGRLAERKVLATSASPTAFSFPFVRLLLNLFNRFSFARFLMGSLLLLASSVANQSWRFQTITFTSSASGGSNVTVFCQWIVPVFDDCLRPSVYQRSRIPSIR